MVFCWKCSHRLTTSPFLAGKISPIALFLIDKQFSLKPLACPFERRTYDTKMLIAGKMLGVSWGCKNKRRLPFWLDMKFRKICIALKRSPVSLRLWWILIRLRRNEINVMKLRALLVNCCGEHNLYNSLQQMRKITSNAYICYVTE